MWDHVTIRGADRAASERFYDLVLAALGVERTMTLEHFTAWGEFMLGQAGELHGEEHPVTRGLHIGFRAASHDAVDAFWRAGVEAGYTDDGASGPRPEYTPTYYGGFLLDPDGNSAEAVHHANMRGAGVIDHLWIRVADVAAARDFYALAAPHAGFELVKDTPELARFKAPQGGSFSVLRDERPATEHVHMAFPAVDQEAVGAFHRALTDAGHRDNGPPGERPAYHAGYHAAFALDPDGNNIEAVNR